MYIDPRILRGRSTSDEPLGNMRLGPVEGRVENCCANHPIEVHHLDGVEVHHSDVIEAGGCEPQRDFEADAAGPDDQHTKACDVGLDAFPPSRRGP
jgi:hypothetical protein